MELVKTIDLTKSFGSVKAVDKVSVTLQSGKIYGLLGPNGSGKTTLMRMIAGLFYPAKGSIEVNEEKISVASKASIAYMPTESFFYDYMKIKDVENFFTDFFEDFDKEKFDELLGKMKLERKMKISSLSSGMNAKLRVALTMARKAKVYLLDEPLNGIDLLARDAIMAAIIGGANEENAVVISSHLIDVMENVLDDVIFIKDGQIVINENAEEAREKHSKSIADLYKEVYA
ncbi:MAG: ABC transporter ATP-binding protein [Eubacteriales bacterium]